MAIEFDKPRTQVLHKMYTMIWQAFKHNCDEQDIKSAMQLMDQAEMSQEEINLYIDEIWIKDFCHTAHHIPRTDL
jgi:hypothetical protein